MDVTGCATLATIGTGAAGTAGHRVAGGLGTVTQRGDLSRRSADNAATLASVDALAAGGTGGRAAGLGTVATGDDAGLAAVAARATTDRTGAGVSAITAGSSTVRGSSGAAGMTTGAVDDASRAVAALAADAGGFTAVAAGGRAVREATLTFGLHFTEGTVAANAAGDPGPAVAAGRGRCVAAATDDAAGVVDDQVARTAAAAGAGVAQSTGPALGGAGDGAVGAVGIGDRLATDTALATVETVAAVTAGDVGARKDRAAVVLAGWVTGCWRRRLQ